METGIAYYGNRIIKHVQADLEDIAAHYCTYVVHTLSETDILTYRDTMAKIIRATHQLGMRAWLAPWGIGGVFAGDVPSYYLARNPTHQQILSTGERLPAACPNRMEFREFVRQWIDTAIDLGADTLFWNEPHWGAPYHQNQPETALDSWSCHCVACQYRYRERYGEELPNTIVPSVRIFRQECMLDFLADITGYAATKSVTNALNLPAISDHHPQGLPFAAAASLPNVHIFGTSPYWHFTHLTLEEHVSQQTARVVELCHYLGKPAQIWVHGFGIPEGCESEINTALELASRGGADYVAAWGYPHCEPISPQSSNNPPLVWDIIGRNYKRLLYR
jgi:hypothetical protein